MALPLIGTEGRLAEVVGRGRDLRAERTLYYGAKFVAQIAQNTMLAALLVAASGGGNAAMGLSSLFVAQLVPAIALGLAGGAVADRLGAARGFALGSFLRLLPVAAGLFFLHDAASAMVVAFFYSAGSQIFSPAEMALVRTLQREAPGKAHAWLVALQYGGQAVGMLVLGPGLYFLGGARMMLGGAAVTFALLALMAIALAWQLRGTPAVTAQSTRRAFAFGETLRFFGAEPSARYAIVAIALKTTVARGIVVALPIYLSQDLNLGHEALVFLFAPGVVGALLGLVWSRNLTLRRAQDAMRLSVIGMVVSVFALAVLDYGLHAVVRFSQVAPMVSLETHLNTTFVVALPAAFLLGLAFSVSIVSARVALTETAPVEQQARVFATQETLTESLLVLPLLLTGIGAEMAGARTTLAAIGIVAVFAFALLELPRFRRLPVPAPLPEAVPAVAD